MAIWFLLLHELYKYLELQKPKKYVESKFTFLRQNLAKASENHYTLLNTTQTWFWSSSCVIQLFSRVRKPWKKSQSNDKDEVKSKDSITTKTMIETPVPYIFSISFVMTLWFWERSETESHSDCVHVLKLLGQITY